MKTILADDDYFDLPYDADADWESDLEDRDEAALYARLRDADARGSLDLEALAVLASKPWKGGGGEAA